jgi:hypothetical protein
MYAVSVSDGKTRFFKSSRVLGCLLFAVFALAACDTNTTISFQSDPKILRGAWTGAMQTKCDASTRSSFFSPEGDLVATLIYEPTRKVVIWNSQTGAVQREIPMDTTPYDFLKWAGDNRRIYIARENHAEIYDVQSDQPPVRTSTLSKDSFVSPNGTFVYSREMGTPDTGYSIDVTELRSGKTVANIKFAGTFTGAAFSLDETAFNLVSTGKDFLQYSSLNLLTRKVSQFTVRQELNIPYTDGTPLPANSRKYYFPSGTAAHDPSLDENLYYAETLVFDSDSKTLRTEKTVINPRNISANGSYTIIGTRTKKGCFQTVKSTENSKTFGSFKMNDADWRDVKATFTPTFVNSGQYTFAAPLEIENGGTVKLMGAMFFGCSTRPFVGTQDCVSLSPNMLTANRNGLSPKSLEVNGQKVEFEDFDFSAGRYEYRFRFDFEGKQYRVFLNRVL